MPPKSKSPSRMLQFAILGSVVIAFIVFGALFRASSQGDSSQTYPKGFRGGACTIESGALIVGYSGYYLPDDYVIPEDAIRTPHAPIQCGKIHKPGILNITIDLLYPESTRDIPLALRLVKVETNATERAVQSIPAQQHQSGVITHAFKLSELGQYILYLDNAGPENPDFPVKVPIKVGSDWKDNLKNLFSTFLSKQTINDQ